jgi:ADP-ribosylglycohydrolase
MKRASGCLYGLAFGDALGRSTEFLGYDEIVSRHGPDGPRALTGDPALVTDDTQLTLAVGDALLAADEPLEPDRFEPLLRERFVAWSDSPDNDRAPGATCLDACARLAAGQPWQEASVARSKGCGANMRVAPVGLVLDLTDEERSGAAQLQAGLTHGHPTGLAASELTAYAVFLLCEDLDPVDLLDALRQHCADQRTVYRHRWLGDLWRRSGVDATPEDFIARGWDECADALARVDAALGGPRSPGDPCLATGAGWIAEEALATALYCYLLSPDEPVAVLGRAAATSGDSDSIACLAGAFAGAALGLGAWPDGWPDRIEYADRLHRLGAAWD